MFKSPISKDGKIRYFEVVKIAVVVLTVFALFSKVSESSISLLVTLKLVIIIEVMLCISLVLLVLNEVRTIISIIKSFKLIIQSYRIKQRFITVLQNVITVVLKYKEKIFIKIHVLRC